MTGRDHLVRVIEICGKCEELTRNLPEGSGKEQFLKKLSDQKAVVENMMDRVFFKTPKGMNSASIVLESCEKLREAVESLGQGPEESWSKRWTETEEELQEFAERVEGMVQSAQGKTLAFT